MTLTEYLQIESLAQYIGLEGGHSVTVCAEDDKLVVRLNGQDTLSVNDFGSIGASAAINFLSGVLQGIYLTKAQHT